MADGLLSFRGILQRMIVEAESEGAHADQYPNIRKILARQVFEFVICNARNSRTIKNIFST